MAIFKADRYIRRMSPKTESIIRDILRLPKDVRALIAERVLESLDYEEPFELSEEWQKALARRCQEIDSGDVQLIPGEQVISEASARLKK